MHALATQQTKEIVTAALTANGNGTFYGPA